MAEWAKAEDRKQEFLATALALFYAKGYEKTTIQDIIEKMRVSKGAFYHYFQSKEDIVLSIAAEFAGETVKVIAKIAGRGDLTAVQKINKAIEAVNEHNGSAEAQKAIMRGILNSEENLKLQSKISASIRHQAGMLMEKIIDLGIKEGVFKTVSSRELAEFTIYTLDDLNTSIAELLRELRGGEEVFNYQAFIERLDQKLMLYEEVLARVFQVPEGAINLLPPYLKRFTGENA